MPFTMKKKSTRRPRRRMVPRRRVPLRRYNRGGVIERAGAQFSTASVPLFPNANVYAFRNFALSNASQRVQNIAQGYQFFRIKRVSWQVRPAYDTFQAGSSGSPTSIPQLYWRVDKDAVYNTTTSLQTLKASGCKPIRLDDKIIVKSFKPSVLQAVAEKPGDETTGALSLVLGTSRISPWLPTDNNAYMSQSDWSANSVDHNGLLISIDQDVGVSASSPVAYISFTIEYEFKKPLDVSTAGQQGTLTEVDLATAVPGYVPPSEEIMSS